MTLPGVNPDIEAQANTVTETQPAIIPNPPPATNSANPQLSRISDQAQATSANEHYDRNAPAQQTAETPQIQRDENQGDSSDGLWSIYLTEAEKQDTQVIESWKGDTDGILVFTGLFSATVAGFLIESYKKLSPDSSDTTNALLAQISVQLVNISNGIPLAGAGVAAQSTQPFKPTASAVRVNVLWFLSLVLSLNCALSATLMQQWARLYQELAQRRGAFHRRGRMRAYIFDGINRFGMARAVATMPTLLHISVFLFFTGLVEFLFPIYKSVAYATLGCIMVFVLAYAVLTILPTIYLNCPYATPLSGITWRISQLSSFVFLWTTLKLAGLFHKPLFKLWGLTNRHAPGRHGPERWRETLNKRVKFRRQRLSQSLRKSVELSAYRAQSTVVTSALEWTLTALDEDKEIEDFAARVPGFFDSRVVPDATSAVLSLISHQPNTDPIFGSRLYDLLKTCIPGTSLLDDKLRKNRLRVCLNCLWYFSRAYSHPGVSQPLPSYFPNSLIPEIVRRVQTEEDFTLRAIGHCVIAVVISKLAADVKSRTIIVNDGVLTFLSPVLNTEGHDLEFLHNQPGTVALANMISLSFGELGTLADGAVPPDVLDLVQQTLTILSRALLAQEKTELQLGQEVSETDGSYRKFGRILVPHLLYFLNTCVRTPSRLTGEVRTSFLRMCLKRLWFTGRAFNQGGKSLPSPSDLHITFSHPEIIRGIYEHQDPAVRAIGRCVGALVVNNLAVDLNSRIIPASHAELECLSAVLSIGDRSLEPLLLLKQPVPFGVPDMIQQTFIILSQTLLAESQPGRTITIIDGPDRKFERVLESHLFYFLTCIRWSSHLMEEARTSCIRMCLKGLWRVGRAFSQLRHSKPFPPYISIAFAIPRISEQPDLAAREIGWCVGALVVKRLAADLISRTDSISAVELECLSAILRTEDNDYRLPLCQSALRCLGCDSGDVYYPLSGPSR
ncbi:hypothetical protein EDB86DRAFT_1317031 [Lactarius hatsudake]|nr:hypothetical protein EDB86DRAFT_1317031 [Lactarius hatsudake]